MQVLLICSEAQQAELGLLADSVTVVRELHSPPAGYDAVVDLLFEDAPAGRLSLLVGSSATVVVAALLLTTKDLPPQWVRVNGWPTFLGGVVEACAGPQADRQLVTALFALLGRHPEWVPDVPGMISARVVAGIINEAYLTFSEGIASRADIDTAMRLGTNYPYGPFTWAEKIGIERVRALLERLAQSEQRYAPCAALAAGA